MQSYALDTCIFPLFEIVRCTMRRFLAISFALFFSLVLSFFFNAPWTGLGHTIIICKDRFAAINCIYIQAPTSCRKPLWVLSSCVHSLPST